MHKAPVRGTIRTLSARIFDIENGLGNHGVYSLRSRLGKEDKG